MVPFAIRVRHLPHRGRELEIRRLVGEGRPEERRDDGSVERGLAEYGGGRLVPRRGRPRRGRRLHVSVDALRVVHVLQHHLALVQRRLAESKLQQLQRVRLAIDVIPHLVQQTLRQHVTVLVDEQLLTPVDAHQLPQRVVHVSPPTTRGRRLRFHGFGFPLVPPATAAPLSRGAPPVTLAVEEVPLLAFPSVVRVPFALRASQPSALPVGVLVPA